MRGRAGTATAGGKAATVDLSIVADKAVLGSKVVVGDAALKLRDQAAARQGELLAVTINANQHVGRCGRDPRGAAGRQPEQDQFCDATEEGPAMMMNRAFPIDRAEDRDARRHFPSVWKLTTPYWATREGALSALVLAFVLGLERNLYRPLVESLDWHVLRRRGEQQVSDTAVAAIAIPVDVDSGHRAGDVHRGAAVDRRNSLAPMVDYLAGRTMAGSAPCSCRSAATSPPAP